MVDEKGPLIATLQDGTRIYKRGLVDSRGYVEATIGIYNFSSEFNPNTGKWESVAATLALPIGNKIEFQPDGDAMKVSIGGSVPVAGPTTIDLAI